MKRAILALGAALALSVGLALPAPAQAQTITETVTITPRANAVETGKVIAAPDGAVFNITVYDPALAVGQKTVSYTVQPGNSIHQVANKIVQAINADTDLQAIGVTATLGTGPNYTIQSSSTNGTLYKQTTTGGGSNRLAIQQTLTVGGTVTVDDKLTLTIFDAGLVGGSEAVVYKPNTGDTIADIVVRLRNRINNSTTLSALGITAKVSPTDSSVLLIESPTFDVTEKFTSYSAVVKAGGTETMALGSFWGTNGRQTISVGGTVTVGDVVPFTVFNVDLPDSQKTVSYTVQAGDNLNQIRCGLRTEVNNDADLAAIGVHATCSGGVIGVTSTSSNPTAYLNLAKFLCKDVISNPTAWPSAAQVKACGASFAGSNSFVVRSTVEALGDSNAFPGGGGTPDAAQKLQSANPSITWYLYANHNEFYLSGDWFFNQTGGPNAGIVSTIENSTPAWISDRKNALGFSFNSPRFSLIFENSLDLHESVSDAIPGTYIRHATAHETGHHLNTLYANASASAEFQAAFQRDLAGMDLIPACKKESTDGRAVFGDPPERSGGYYTNGTDQRMAGDGEGGFFSGIKDYKGSYICDGTEGTGYSLTGVYAGLSNTAVISKAFPRFSVGQNQTLADYPLSELFPELYAVQAGFLDDVLNDGSSASNADCAQFVMCSNRLFTQQFYAFACTRLYVQTMTQDGRIPNASELSITGYFVPDVVPLSAPADGGMLGYGVRLHSCDGAVGDLRQYNYGA